MFITAFPPLNSSNNVPFMPSINWGKNKFIMLPSVIKLTGYHPSIIVLVRDP